MSVGPTIATQAFWDAWCGTRQRCILVQIDIAVPSAKTLRISDQEVALSGTTWVRAIVDADPIEAPGAFLSSDVARCTTRYRLADTAMAGQTAGETLTDLVADWKLQGATITEYLWEMTLADFATDALPSFRGVIDRVDVGSDANGPYLDLWCIQGDGWDVEVPTRVVNKVEFPNAADSAIGRPIPIGYGTFKNRILHVPPFDDTPTLESWEQYVDSGMGSGAVPTLITNRGVSGSDLEALIFDHAGAQGSSAGEYQSLINAGDVLARLDPNGFVGTNPCRIEIPEGDTIAHVAVIPVDVDTANNTCTDARNALDVADDLHYALITQAAGTDDLSLILPNMGSLGEVLSVRALVALDYISGTGSLELVYDGVTLGNPGPVGTRAEIVSLNVAAFDQEWQWGSGVSAKTFILRPAGGSANLVVRVYWMLLSVEYRPRKNTLIPATFLVDRKDFRPRPLDPPGWAGYPIHVGFGVTILGKRPGVYELTGTFYAHVDGNAEVTPTDIVRALLEDYGGAVSNDFVTSSFGSFAAGEDLLRAEQPDDFALAVHIGEVSRISKVIEDIARQSLISFYMDRFRLGTGAHGKWSVDAWTRGAARDGPIFGRDDLIDPRVNEISDAAVRYHVRAGWFYDFFRNSYMHEAVVNQNESARDFEMPDQGPNDLTIVAGVNDDLNWTGAGTYADVIDAGAYSPPLDLAENIRGKMRGDDANIHVGHGFDMMVGGDVANPYNIRIDFRFPTGSTTYVAEVADAHRISAQKACRLVKAALDAQVENGWSVTYSDATNKFTISGTAAFDLRPATGTNYNKSALIVLGFTSDRTNVTSATADLARYYGRFWFYSKTGSIGLLFSTGASATTSCAHVLGWTRDNDYGGVSHAPRQTGDRETLADDSLAQHGPRDPMIAELRHVREENQAVDWVNRMFDLNRLPPVIWTFVTDRAMDLQRRRVIAGYGSSYGDLDVGGLCPMTAYGKGGDWDGLLWKVLAVRQHRVKSWHQEVSAVLVDG